MLLAQVRQAQPVIQLQLLLLLANHLQLLERFLGLLQPALLQ
jgi:hypothetical protein